MADYFSFEDVMKELELGEEELKRMVSEGELRAFRDENKMKFRKEDVDNLKKGRITEPTIILPSTPSGETTDETVLDLNIGQETAALSDTAAPTMELDDSGRPPGDTDDNLLVTEPEVGTEAEETFIEEEDTGLSTEPLKLADEAGEETVEADSVSEEVAEAPRGGRRTGATRAGRRVSAQVPMAVEEEIEKKRAHPVWTVFMILTFVVGAYSGLFFYDMMRMESGKGDQPLSMTAGTAEWILKQFWGDAKWTQFHTKDYPEGKAPPYNDPEAGISYPADTYTGPSFMKPDTVPPVQKP